MDGDILIAVSAADVIFGEAVSGSFIDSFNFFEPSVKLADGRPVDVLAGSSVVAKNFCRHP